MPAAGPLRAHGGEKHVQDPSEDDEVSETEESDTSDESSEEEAANLQYYDPDQPLEERRQVRSELRDLSRVIHGNYNTASSRRCSRRIYLLVIQTLAVSTCR